LTFATMPVTSGTNPSPLAIATTPRVIETMPRATIPAPAALVRRSVYEGGTCPPQFLTEAD
jgi:hypothetical protein